MTAGRQVLIALVTAAALAGCGGDPPTGPGKNLVSLAIEPTNIEVGAGLTQQLRARARYSDQSSEEVTVRWAVTPNSVAAISDTGELFGIRLGIAIVTATHESGITAGAPVKVVNNPAFTFQNDMSGIWQGEYTLDVCVKIAGAGPESCRFELESRLPIRLQLTQNGTALSGQLTLYSVATGSVTGWRDSAGFYVLFGKLTGSDERGTITAEITKWEVKATTFVNEMTGSIETLDRFSTSLGPQVYRRGGTFVSVKRIGQ